MATLECKVESWDEEVAFNIYIRFFTLFQFPIMFGFFLLQNFSCLRNGTAGNVEK